MCAFFAARNEGPTSLEPTQKTPGSLRKHDAGHCLGSGPGDGYTRCSPVQQLALACCLPEDFGLIGLTWTVTTFVTLMSIPAST